MTSAGTKGAAVLATVADLRRGDVYSDRGGIGWLALGDARQGGSAGCWAVPSVEFMRLGECPDTGAWTLGSLPVMETDQDGAEPVQIVERGHRWTEGHGGAEGAGEGPSGLAGADPRAAELAADVEAWREAQTVEDERETAVRESVRRQMAAGLDYREVMRITGWGKSRVYQVRDGKRS
ncbi:hypothetical protein [Streptacidiphilus sp. P02-A3a]|uniref:hypothetical protein n=1 Tax=Streptacidiphilus sp. P02-A3a TaxID=2704468 RepID=UPI0015F95FC3|nr:hypothetical protein [Streptacidiphilus sp. P02-A3a]QMU72149.1 hypothetical protein GXP74_31830 [Streptacidiphilus sp. P02-A3a]